MFLIVALLALSSNALPCSNTLLHEQKTRPAICPWCKNDPELMAKAGIVSHGPIAIGPKGGTQIEESLGSSKWIFLETAHLRWASALGPVAVELDDKKRVVAELDRLREVLPLVPKDTGKLDPYLRLHLFAMKGEEFYARFQKLLAVSDADFPESRKSDGPFMGNGRFLGEKDKFEVVLHTSHASHEQFTKDFCGVGVTGALRWHFNDLAKLLVSVPAEDPDLKKDKWLWPHVVHNLSHAFFCGYKHFSYDPPIWIDEGLALAMEKEVEPQSTTHEGEEGSLRETKGPKDFAAAAKHIVGAGKSRSVADLTTVKEFGALSQDDGVTVWSMTRFLIDAHPAEMAKILGGLKGQLDPKGYPTGANLPDLQRSMFKESGWSLSEFDAAWREWVAKQP